MHPLKDFELALAGLLHDIGKFMLRAHESGIILWDGDAQADFKYKHAMLSDSFVGQFVPEAWREFVRGPVSNHHKPKTARDRIVTLADWLAAGERDDELRADLPKAVRQRLSIFASIDLDGQKLQGNNLANAYLPLSPLQMAEEALFPGPSWPDDDVDRAYRRLWEDFQLDAIALREAHAQNGQLNSYLESMLLLLQRYTWSVPSAYWKTTPDISLYDHSRMTGALAAVLANWKDDAVASLLHSDPAQSSADVALLVGGDISGVQDFIYTISTRRAVSALRGRSFYLQLLTEAIARYVLRRLNLPITNLIYQGGGNFTILARAKDADQLQPIQRDISRILLQHHRGDLYVALAGVPLAARDFFGDLGPQWTALADAQQDQKLRRFSELDKKTLCWLFEPMGHGGNEEKQCQVCGREHAGAKAEDGVRKCPPCRSYENLGNDLRKARFLALTWLPVTDAASAPDLKEPPGGYEDALAAFGMKAAVFADLQDAPPSNQPMTLLAIHDDAQDALRPGPRLAVGRRLLVNVTPILTEAAYFQFKGEEPDLPRHRADGSWPDPVKPFSILARESTGIKRLGVLRMDVDNLGRLFSEGLGEKATLSRVAGLSSAISLFFEGWVEKIAEEMPGDRLYSIYSGGDDLFFVGSWDAVADFAREVRRDLGRYAAKHPAIHASAGIALVGGKYPLAQAADDAGEAEHAAKSYQRWDDAQKRMVTAKDAISFLGQVQPWRIFGLDDKQGMNTVVGLQRMLVAMIDDGAPKSLVRNLSRLYAQHEAEERRRRELGEDVTRHGQRQPLWGPWMWRGYYLLKRSKIDAVQELAEALHREDFRNMAWMGLAARWAELLTK